MDNQRLTRHFNLFDFLASETALRAGIENVPHAPDVILNLQRVALHLLEPVLQQFDTRPQITSGYRCPALNAKVGGAATSQHMSGQAVDFQLPHVPLLELARWMRATLTYDQLLLETVAGETWIHASYVDGKNRGQVRWFDGMQWRDGLPESLSEKEKS